MKLIELNPKYGATDGVRTHLIFDCPNCSHEDKCIIAIPFIGKPAWEKTGDDFESMSINPSIWFNMKKQNPTNCEAHFFIKKGMIEMA